MNHIPRHCERKNLAKLNGRLLHCAILYYWSYLYFQVFIPSPSESFLGWLCVTGPVFLFSVVGLSIGVASNKILNNRLSSWLALVIYFIVVLAVSATRSDYSNIRQTLLFVLVTLWLSTIRNGIDTRSLNKLFLASIVASAIFYHAGWSEYGILTSLEVNVGHAGMWRASLFPYLPESAFFSALVLLVNLNSHESGFWKWMYCTLAAYFLVFSGVRSAAISFVLSALFIYADTRIVGQLRCQMLTRRRIIFVSLLLLFFLIIYGALALKFFTWIQGSAIGIYLLKEMPINDDDIRKSIYRIWLWQEHISIWLRNIWVGIGSYDFKQIVGYGLIHDFEQTGSESLITRKLSELGLLCLPFYAFLWIEFERAISDINPFYAAAFTSLVLMMLSYGSIIVPYNFIFILFFSILLCQRNGSSRC